jgi:hypothetical protein
MNATSPGSTSTWTADEVRQLGLTTEVATAGAILGIGLTKAYELARTDESPFRCCTSDAATLSPHRICSLSLVRSSHRHRPDERAHAGFGEGCAAAAVAALGAFPARTRRYLGVSLIDPDDRTGAAFRAGRRVQFLGRRPSLPGPDRVVP